MKTRTKFLFAWVLLPLLAWWFHSRYGPLLIAHDKAGQLIRIASDKIKVSDWAGAQASETQLLTLLPNDSAHHNDRLRTQIAIETAKAQQQLRAEAIADLTEMLHALDTDPAASESVRRDIHRELAQMYYESGWQLRLDGSQRWLTQLERARQHFHYLAETAVDPDEKSAEVQNTEAAIRLEQMDLSELRAYPPPNPSNSSAAGNASSDKDETDQGSPAPSNQPTQADPPDPEHGKGGNSGGKYARPFKGS